MIKKIIIISLVIAIIVSLVVIIKAINFGALTIKLIEQTAKIKIDYQRLKGNVLTGFQIEDYCVCLSPSDSLMGATADINYRLRPLGLRLPSLFEVTLIEPTLSLAHKESRDPSQGFRLPTFNIGLRLVVKNGKIKYRSETTYDFTGISGLVFVDLVGDHLYLNTVNLAFQSVDYPIKINSANIDLRIAGESIEARSFRIKGSGLSLAGSGHYLINEKTGFINITSSTLDMTQFSQISGTVELKGEIGYQNRKLIPKVQGKAYRIEPFEKFSFETNSSADTIMINLFDGVLLEGELFAQIMYLDQNNWTMESNFKHLNVNNYLSLSEPIFINGFVAYRQKKFTAFVNSPADSGINVDSLYLFGAMNQNAINIDSGFICDEIRSLQFSGNLGTDFNIEFKFDDFDLTHLIRLLPLDGKVKGSCRVAGNIKRLALTEISSDLQIKNFAYNDIRASHIELTSELFSFEELKNKLEIKARKLHYKNLVGDTLEFLIDNGRYSIAAWYDNGIFKSTGKLDQDKKGTIDSLYLIYRDIVTSNDGPIVFDLKKLEIGDFRLFFIDGYLEGNLNERRFTLTQGDLSSFGKMIGLADTMQGKLDLSIVKDSFTIDAQNISFRGLDQGNLLGYGNITMQKLDIKHLNIHDISQSLEINGYWIKNHVEINAKLNDVGIWTLFFLEKILKDPSGLMSGSVSFNGNLDEFKFTGSGTIKKGAFTIEAIDARIDSAEGNVKFDKTKIYFEQATGRLTTLNRLPMPTSSGQVSGGGIISLEPKLKVRNLNFDFNFADAPLQFQPYAFGIGSGNFTVSLIENIAHYKGNINVKQGTVPIDFGMRVKVERPVNEEDWRMNIRVKGERNIWLRNRETDIEFGGELFIIKEQGAPYLSGTMQTHRGNFYWLNHVLAITNGELTFIPEEKIDPELDVWAEMDTREGVKIILHCFGPISEPVFEFFSDPPDYTEQDIVMYLNLNLTWRELESLKQGEYVGSVLPNAIVSWLESDVSRRIRRYTGLDYFRIETPLFEPESKTKVTVGKYISKNLFITYTYDITSFSNMFNVEYFIDDKNEIIIKRDDEGEYSMQYQYRIRF